MGVIRYAGQAIPAEAGKDLLMTLLDAGADVQYLCMSGSCGTCRVRITAGGDQLEPLTRAETYHRCSGRDRLACQAIQRGGDVGVEQ
jgi:ferredoxin